ncbi:MAG: hypothetical protein QXS79_06700 [Candidatus Bathyarchaeia archaeon]
MDSIEDGRFMLRRALRKLTPAPEIIRRLRGLSSRLLRLNCSLKHIFGGRSFLRVFLKCAIIVFVLSALIDYILWFTINFHVPCWAIATMSLSTSLILYAIIKLLPETRH